MIYVASPYSHPEPAVRQKRFEAACSATADLIRAGNIVLCPVIQGHFMTTYGLPGDWSFWKEHDLRRLEQCQEIVVLMLDGWEQSEGVQAEIEHATVLGISVTYRDPACP